MHQAGIIILQHSYDMFYQQLTTRTRDNLIVLLRCCIACPQSQGLSDGGYASLPVPAAADAWRARAAWLHDAEVAAAGSSQVPDMSTTALMSDLQAWLGPHLAGVRSKAVLQKLPWLDIFKGMVGAGQGERCICYSPAANSVYSLVGEWLCGQVDLH